jgi:putative transposase
MQIQKTIRAKIIGLTNTKEKLISEEYKNFQLALKGIDVNLYSATKQQALRYGRKFKNHKEYPLIIRRDVFKIERQNTKLSKYWVKIPCYGRRGGVWVAVKFSPTQEELLNCSIRESKLIRRNDKWFLFITIQKEVEIKKSYSSILGIDFGMKWVATVCDISNLKPKFYGKELRRIRGHYFYLRRKLAKKKIRGFYKWINNNKEKRVVNDLLHKISRDIVNKAKETNSLIAFGELKGIRKQNKGRRFNRKLNSFPYFKLAQYIRYKANEQGILVLEIPESYTSQLCWKCGNRGIRKNGLFKCECGLKDNSDRNGAINIAKRALEYISKVGVDVTLPETEAVNIKIPTSNTVSDLRSLGIYS